LLTAILLLQQAGRFTDVLFGAQIPAALIWELVLALLPNILAFTSPMALFAGVMVGLGQMQGDSELIALRAAGASNFKILSSNLLLGFLLTILTLYINFEGVPKSAQLVRQVGTKAALAKLESPLEPGVFNNEIPKYVIYTREGNVEKGVWERVFIHAVEKNNQVRLITAKSGKIDSANEQSELVLQDAVVTTLDGGKQIALERVNSLRVAMEMGRKQLLEKLQKIERVPDEMGLSELAAFSSQKSGKEKLDAEILWHRRVSLALAPILFAFLGVALSLRYARGGRGFNGILALFVLICYYLLSLFCEQLSRAGSIPAFVGSWIAPILAFFVSLWLLSKSGRAINFGFFKRDKAVRENSSKSFENKRKTFKRNDQTKKLRFDFSGLLNRDILIDFFKYFVFATGGLLSLYLIFTSFELWRFAATTPSGFVILGKYLFYISPIVIFQVVPSALLLSVLFTYGLKSRKSEIVAWGAAGQNIYRLLIPIFMLSALIGWGAWLLQENVLPQTNKRQDALRAQLRGGGATLSQQGRFWFATPQKIYSFVTDKNNQANQPAQLKEVDIYDFRDDGVHLKRLIRSAAGVWTSGDIQLQKTVEVVWRENLVEIENNNKPQNVRVEEGIADLNLGGSKFFYESIGDVRERLNVTESIGEARRLSVVLQKHYTVIILPLIIVLFSAPFAVTFGTRGNNKTNLALLTVFGIWLLFMAIASVFEQLGYSGSLTEFVAVWTPLLMLASLGTYFLAKIRN
jgi:LPS export ABC transporter permease LptF